MSTITTAKAYTNGEVGYLAWQISGMIPGCLGFAITRIFLDGVTPAKPLAAWVPFKGQSNPDWNPQDTTVWPIQKLSWRDLTLVKSRDTLNTRTQGFKVKYLIRPVVAMQPGLTQIPVTLPVTYKGTPIALAYLDDGLETNEITVSTQFGNIRATFTNGILATQWLANVLKKAGGSPLTTLKKDIAIPGNSVRNYLAGPVIDTLKELLLRAKGNPAATLRMALYEFNDKELKDAVLDVKDQVEMILSNTSKNSKGIWDTENDAYRKLMHNEGVNITDRFFNNDHIGHNKFVIYLEGGIPKAVLTGSTNWTPNGLCAQSNNAAVIDSPEIAAYYNAYFDELKKDTAMFKVPNPTSASTSNVQGSLFHSFNAKGNLPVTLQDNTKLTIWFSPNAGSGATNTKTVPPDLSAVYSLMRKAERAIFFAVFLPGMSYNASQSDIMTNIITEAISIGSKDPSLLVYGSISSPKAMPNYIPPIKKNAPEDDDNVTTKVKQPTVYDTQNVHLVRASNISSDDPVGDFETELLSAGAAIIHNKIIVIDPFSDNPVAILGSHNLGFKASYGNDENLVIIQNNKALVQSYAVHVLDIYEHYRFRAVQQEMHNEHKTEWDGFLSVNDSWLEQVMSATGKGTLANYICEG